MNPGDIYPIPESTSTDPPNAGLRFEIIAGEWDTGERAIRCNHWRELDSLNSALDQLAEVVSVLEIVCRGLYYHGHDDR